MKLWIARDEYNILGLFFEKPEYQEQLRCWVKAPFATYLPPSTFPEVTFENSPQQVEIKLVKQL